MNLILDIINLTKHIDEESAAKIDYYLHNDENAIDLIALYFDDKLSFRQIQQNLLNFVEQNKHLYNFDWDGITDFIVNTITTFWLVDNFMFTWEDLENIKRFLSLNKDLFTKIFEDKNNPLDIKIKCESILNYFLKESLFSYDTSLSDIEQLWDKKIAVYYLLMSDKKEVYSKLFNQDINSFLFWTPEVNEFAQSLIIKRLTAIKGKAWNEFVLKNIEKLWTESQTFNFDRDFNLGMMVLLAPFNNEKKLQYFKDLELDTISYAQLVNSYFDINLEDNPKETLAFFYNKWFSLRTQSIFPINEINFDSFESSYRYVKTNFNHFEWLEKKYLLQLFYDAIQFTDLALVAKIENDIQTFESIIPDIDLSKIQNNYDLFDKIVADISDNEIKVNYYKTFFASKNYVLEHVLASLDEVSLKDLLVFNKDPEIEKQILQLIATQDSSWNFMELYIANLFAENNFDKHKYLFDYNQIMVDIGKGKWDLQTIAIIFQAKSFCQQDILKIGDFVEFLISNQSNNYSRLKIIQMFLELKSMFIDKEYFDIIVKNILVTYLWKNNILKKFITEVDQNISVILWSKPKEWLLDKVKSFFGTRSDIERLREAKKYELSADQLDSENQNILKKFSDELKEIDAFISQYERFFTEMELRAVIDDFRANKLKIETFLR